VLFKFFLRIAVEGEHSHSAVEMRGSDTPSAIGAAPSAEVIAVYPDQAFIHAYTLACLRVGFEHGRGGRNTSSEGGLLPAAEYFPRIRNPAK
jgi:hypothetical protein